MRLHGFSLFELLLVLAIVATLVGLAWPALGDLVLDARRSREINALVAAVELARSESVKRGATVTLCPSIGGTSCADADTDGGYQAGWIVVVEASNRTRQNADDTVLLIHRPALTGQITSNRARFTFRAYYRRSTNGTITFCDARGADAARAVILSYTGRPRVSDTGPGGRPLDCAP